ncbi:glycosyl hydrolase family 8 [Alteromonas sp. 14N.309.X.WAT.G.H12]|uniref:glycosyl hydrolase family 8 n=1 Tax=Alteromonas sp. 14N.309.X.WAT.G.H12 TaxID=3120824 RepID=UPI002FD477D7
MVMNVVKWLALVLIMLLSACSKSQNSEFATAFITYKALFIDHGRVVDSGNENVSHSEGQGYGMLFSVAADDKATFDNLWTWTKSTLQKESGLFSWRYRPCPSQDRTCIDDVNNASDGELLIAWALLRGAKKWHQTSYQDEARIIIQAVEKRLLVADENHTFLLPGEYGFNDGSSENSLDNLQLNLSYWVFPALLEMARYSQHPERWQSLFDSGVVLMAKAQFTAHRLPPDWLRYQQSEVTLNKVILPVYGFNAVRIPLHIVWAGEAISQTERRQLLAPFRLWWEQADTPATLNLITEERATYPMTAGMRAVTEAVRCLTEEHVPTWPKMDRNMDYYSASLTMLSMLAVADRKS